MNDYLQIVGGNYYSSQEQRISFQEQHISPYINQETKTLLISWKPEPFNEAAYICR